MTSRLFAHLRKKKRRKARGKMINVTTTAITEDSVRPTPDTPMYPGEF